MSDKSYVTMEQKKCPVCGKSFDSGSILMNTRLKAVFERYTVTGFAMCDEHQELWEKGYSALVVCDDSKTTHSGGYCKAEDAFRTGEVIHMRKKVFKQFFNRKPEKVVFIDTKAAKKIRRWADAKPHNELS